MKLKSKLAVPLILTLVFCLFFSATQSAGQNTDSLRLAKESRHFKFYSTTDDIAALDSLADRLEGNYSRITNRLGIKIDKKINVKVFPDVKAFHAAINYPSAPDWVVGTLSADELWMVSPLNPGSKHTFESLMQVIVHEFTHLAVYFALGEKPAAEIPQWLNEGYAQYEAGQINEPTRRSVKSWLSTKEPPTWAQLNSVSSAEFGNMNGYGFSSMIVEFLVVKYGINKLVLLIKEPENMEQIYDLPKDSLEKQWVQYLKHGQIE